MRRRFAFHDEFGVPAATLVIDSGEDPERVDSGLPDQFGKPIMVFVRPRDPLGFLWHDDNGALRPRHEFTDQ